MKTTLVIVDMQNDYFPGGRNPLEGSPQAAEQARKLLDLFREKDWPRVHIQHIALKPGATFFLPGTEGAEIYEAVRPMPGEAVIEKHFPNSFRQTELLETLRQAGSERLVVCGMMTHMCVDATVRAAVDGGFETLTAQDACATKALAFDGQPVPAAQVHAAFLAALKGTYGSVLTVEAILQQLREEA
jgi:nicotinamidase-related amidase